MKYSYILLQSQEYFFFQFPKLFLKIRAHVFVTTEMFLGDSVASFRNVNTHYMSHNMSHNMLHVKIRRPGVQPKIRLQENSRNRDLNR